MIEPYNIAVCQSDRIVGMAEGLDRVREVARKNLDRYCGMIDFVCGGGLVGVPGMSVTGQVKLCTFGEFSITGNHLGTTPVQKTLSNKEIIKYLAISIPGEETDILAAKAKQYGVYIAAVNYENDPQWPDFYFNTGFIINPKGKVILKYRKTACNNPVEMACSAHDIMDAYKDPITGKYDPFPVVDTAIGRLAIMICADLVAPEIPRIYSIKGAEIVLHLTSGMSNSGGGIRAPGATEAALQAAAWHNCIYMVNSNWALELGAYYPKARISGDSCAFDYTGNELVRAPDSNEQILRAKIDIEACRKYRQQFFNNYVTVIRTELYAPFYNKPIYPPNQFLRDGAPTTALDEKHRSRIMQTKENLKKLEDYYSEDIVN